MLLHYRFLEVYQLIPLIQLTQLKYKAPCQEKYDCKMFHMGHTQNMLIFVSLSFENGLGFSTSLICYPSAPSPHLLQVVFHDHHLPSLEGHLWAKFWVDCLQKFASDVEIGARKNSFFSDCHVMWFFEEDR